MEIYGNPKGNYSLCRFNKTCKRIEIGISRAVLIIARRFLHQAFLNQSAERIIDRAFVDATILANGTAGRIAGHILVAIFQKTAVDCKLPRL